MRLWFTVLADRRKLIIDCIFPFFRIDMSKLLINAMNLPQAGHSAIAKPLYRRGLGEDHFNTTHPTSSVNILERFDVC